MQTIVLFIGFIGSWLLFAGPMYQAALELKEQDIEIDRIRAAGPKVPKPKSISMWWWLIPPVQIILARRRSQEYRKKYIKALRHEDAEALISFMNKATAWMLVGLGGFCIAFQETDDLAEHMSWNTWLVLIMIALAFLASLNFIMARLKRERRILTKLRGDQQE